MQSHLVLGRHLHLTSGKPRQRASYANLSGPLQLSLVYSEPSISARALPPSALPTMPSCLLRLHQNCPSATNQTPSQCKSVPATPTCHCHPKPQDNMVGSQHMRRFISERDTHHVKGEKNDFLQMNMQQPYLDECICRMTSPLC